MEQLRGAEDVLFERSAPAVARGARVALQVRTLYSVVGDGPALALALVVGALAAGRAGRRP